MGPEVYLKALTMVRSEVHREGRKIRLKITIDSEHFDAYNPLYNQQVTINNSLSILKWRISDEAFRRYDLDENRIA